MFVKVLNIVYNYIVYADYVKDKLLVSSEIYALINCDDLSSIFENRPIVMSS